MDGNGREIGSFLTKLGLVVFLVVLLVMDSRHDWWIVNTVRGLFP